jgi:signal recognition particle receptor subunit beta
MVFFNYSTMQMAAKIVYYGPGLCGKTTNLQFIYGHTSQDSRGEMVSLETETDRTLFFDLLPIDVGSIAGFNTRIQLYTVPGQVFYNTTRKLVLKGVDGVVFVADSQRPMLQTNAESLKNLEENLGEMSLSLDTLPIVLQYNKRDLPDVCSVEEMEAALNRRGWPSFEASAVTGQGVFETLKGVSKLTLLSLKKRLTKMGSEPARPAPVARPAPAPAPAARPAPAPAPPPQPAAPAPAAPRPAAAAPPAAAARPTPLSPAAKGKPGRVDVLAELEKIRKQAMTTPAGQPAAPAPARPAPPPQRPAAPAPAAAPPPVAPPPATASGAFPKAALNGKGEIHRSVELTLRRNEFRRARRFLLNLRVEDSDRQTVEAIRDLPIEIQDPSQLERVLLQLNIALKSKD